MMRDRIVSATMVLFMLVSLVDAASIERADEARSASGALAEEFLWEVTDIPALCRELNTTPAQLRESVRSEFMQLMPMGEKDYETFLPSNSTVDQEKAIISRFLLDYADGGPPLDGVTAFLLWKTTYRKVEESYTAEDGKEYRKTDEETRRSIKNFCLNALRFHRKVRNTSSLFEIGEKHLNFECWDQLAHFLSFIVTADVESEKVAWWWIRSTISLLRDRALKHHPDSEKLYYALCTIYSLKIVDGSDQRRWYYQGRMAIDSDASMSPAQVGFLKDINPAYGALEISSPASHAVYWAEYGLHRAKDRKRLVSKLTNALKQSCEAGRTALIEDGGEPLAVYTYPNFGLFDLWYDKWRELRASEGPRIDSWARRDMETAVSLCIQYSREEKARQCYVRLGTMFPENAKYQTPFDSFVTHEILGPAGQLGTVELAKIINEVMARSTALIASGNKEDGRGAMIYARRLYDMPPASLTGSAPSFGTIYERSMEAVSADWPARYRDRLRDFSIPTEKTGDRHLFRDQ